MKFEETFAAVNGLSKCGMDFGTERTRALLDGLGSPDKKLKIIHIAGTNGKGSVAEYLTNILICAGKRVGTFTSPAVYTYLEQFRVDGKLLNEELYARAFSAALALNCGGTKFEVETAGALYAFYLAGCEYAVVECGLGGRFDATNAIFKKELALITSISLEHTAILGGSVEDICYHKSGIIKDCPCIISGYNSKEVLSYFSNLGAYVAGKYENPPLIGEAQKYNAALAIEAAKRLNIDENAIYMGVNRTKLGGRIEKLSAGGINYILDGAHNPAAFAPLIEHLQGIGGHICAVYGCLRDKDIDGNLSALSSVAECVYAVKCPSARARDLDSTLAQCKKYFKFAEAKGSVSEALDSANASTVVVCGSFTLLKEAREWIEKRQ